MQKPNLSFWQIWNMSFGFFGIQCGWALQMANMSPIYERLGANPDEIPILWLAAPMTGLIVQPIIGAMSDRTWTRLGRRRPYFLVGAILASIALFLMPLSPAVWVAASMLWIMDSSINISMEPFRAFVADKLNPEQHTTGFVMQSFFIGLGATLASAMPYLLDKGGITGVSSTGMPLAVQYSFWFGSVAFLAAVLVTILTTDEYPPENLEEFRKQHSKTNPGEWVTEIVHALKEMPRTMKQLAVVQIFTWLGLFCMWIFFSPAIARHVFGATDPKSPEYTAGANWGGVCFAAYSVVCFMVAFAIPAIARVVGRKLTHTICLLCGGAGLLSVYVIHDKYMLLASMVGVGIAWASILSMPYAILSGALPQERTGLYMGIFNFFIVLPEIVASITFQPLVKYLFNSEPIKVVMLGGVSMIVAAALVTLVDDVAAHDHAKPVAGGH